MEATSVTLHAAEAGTDIAARVAAIDAGMIALAATITITGRAGDDRIEGTSESEHILGLGGDDRLRGRGGDDTVDGGSGDDELRGDSGNDTLDGGAGDDEVRGDSGNDVVFGGADDDRVEGKIGDDTVSGGTGDDRVKGGLGDDIVAGDAGDDRLWGNLGADTFVFAPGAGRDKIHDFDHAVDVVDLTAYGLTDINALLDSIVQVNLTDSALTLPGGDRILFGNALPGDFAADDFLLV